MDSSVSDSTKEIACATYFSKLSEKKREKENEYHSCEHFVTFLFHNFLMCKKSKESQTQCLLISSK